MQGTRFRCFHVVLIIWSLAYGCTITPAARDLVHYINQDIMGLSEIEAVVLERYEAVSGNNYASDEVLYATLKNDVIPVYRQFLSLLRRVRPETDEVKALHANYLYAAENRLKGFEEVLLGIRLQDRLIITKANEHLAEGRKGMVAWQEALVELYQRYGIVSQL